MTTLSQLEELVLLAERSNKYGSLESKYIKITNHPIEVSALENSLKEISSSSLPDTNSLLFSYGL